MFVGKSKLGPTLVLISLVCIGVCGIGYSSAQAEDSSPTQGARPKDKENPAAKNERMFPDGVIHDFGPVFRGKLLRHTFRIVNTSDVPLRILSARCMI
jgi:hypothetical protein